ncbi:MAG TPA: helicase HerA-like domain-containing protein [Ilumatobacteraceae bacterium]|nr:helicase HerA-like domain-containing protein [Ilumatobacteraceae bacterium]
MADFVLGGQIDPVKHERTQQLTTVASGDLTTHGVIVGMTGSGKTGLGVVVVEEALGAGVPTLLIDPKGDLTNLCLTFPNLAAADFQPWVNEGDATKAGLSVPDFAAAQAKAWTDGLGAWGITTQRIAALRNGVEFTIYTPGSNAGIGLNIVGSLQAPHDVSDSEVVGDEIEGFVSGLLSLVDIDADPLSSREHILLSNLILNEWTSGRSLDLPTLVGLVQQPPIRKLGVFELDQFFPPKDRTALAIRLNGLLASPSFGAWMTGPALDIASLLRTPDGKPRCAIVTTSHLSDQERQFVTTLVLSKLVTWMRGQSGTTDLRVLVYMDEVAGYLPPTATPPTKKPIMTLMKQGRAFGVGVVLSTQNPVDIDYKALSNAGTWMIGRLQTDQDKKRLLDGMSAASGGVDVKAIDDIIAGLAKREFVLRRAGKDQPEVFTTRWAMSYLRGPLTRDQIATLMADQKKAAGSTKRGEGSASDEPQAARGESEAAAGPSTQLGNDETGVLPVVAEGVAVRWADVASPWLTAIGGDSHGARREAAIVARVVLRYDDAKADLVHDEEYEAVLFPLAEPVDASRSVAVDYDDRDLRTDAPNPCVYRLPTVAVKDKTFWSRVERDLVDWLVRSRTVDLQTNRDLKMFGRPGESADDFTARCLAAGNDLADKETAALRGKYADKVARVQSQTQAAEDRAEVLTTERQGRRSEEILSTAGSILGGLLGGGRSRGGMLGSIFGKAGTAAGRRSRTAAAGDRVEAAHNKAEGLHQRLEDLEAELTQEVTAIDARWMAAAKNITTTPVSLERTDVKVTQLALVWIPVP